VVWQGSAGDRRPYADHSLISFASSVGYSAGPHWKDERLARPHT